MIPLSVWLFYFIIILFLFYRLKNNELLKWSDIFNAITFNQYVRQDLIRIPGPVRLPLIGTKWTGWTRQMNKLHKFYEALNAKYGDVVLEMTGGGIAIVSLYNRQDIEKVLKFPSKYPFRPPTEIVSYYRNTRPDRYYSVGLVNSQGEQWAFLRSKLTPKTLESRRVISSFCPDLNHICDDFINTIRTSRNAQNVVVDFTDVLKMMMLEATCCLILGHRMNYLLDTTKGKETFQELATATNNLFKSFRDAYYGNGLWKYFPTKTYRNFVKSEDTIYRVVSDIIKNALDDSEFMAYDSHESNMFLTILKQEGLDMRDKVSGIVDFLAAGIEVTSHTTTFLMHYLTLAPEIQDKIYREAADMNVELTNDDLNKAHYTKAAIHEAFRLSPSAFAIARILDQDMTLSNQRVPAGSVVLCHTMLACNKEENFENAKQFKPERWLNEAGEMDATRGKGSSIVVPFGSGKRICPGKRYSELELQILVIKLVRAFKITYDSPFELSFEFLLAPKGPVNIKFVDREQ